MNESQPGNGNVQIVVEKPTAPDTGNMNKAFENIYFIVAIFGVICVFIIFILVLIDVIRYYIRETKQLGKLANDSSMMIKDTADFDVLRYTSTKEEDEPFNVYAQMSVTKFAFNLVGIGIIILGVHLSLFMGLRIWTLVRGERFNETVNLPKRHIGIIVVVFFAAFILNIIYKRTFLKNVQPQLKSITSRMRDIKSLIYSNLINDSEFLEAIVSDNVDKTTRMMRQFAKSAKNDILLQKMLFTFNLYSYFRVVIPESDPASLEVKKMFTVDSIRNQTIDPVQYFYYKKPIYIGNLYPTLRNDLQPILKTRERGLVKELNIVMSRLNKQLIDLQNIKTGKLQLRGYLWVMLMVSVVFLFIMLTLFYVELSPVLGAVLSKLKGLKTSNTSTGAA